jgi:hypothetical protein
MIIMKIIKFSVLLILLASQVMAQSDSSKRALDAVTQKASAGDIRGLIDSLPNLEPLWNEDPVAYMEAVKVDVQALIKSGNPDAKNAALSALPNLIAKTCPKDTATADSYIRFKYTTLGSYFNFNEVRADKERLLMIAKFLGEVRSLRIPGYQNGGGPHPALMILYNANVRIAADLPTEALKKAYADAVQKDKDDVKMNALQSALSSADFSLTSKLIGYGKGFSVKDYANRQCYQELAKRAKLTEEEIKTLNTPR